MNIIEDIGLVSVFLLALLSVFLFANTSKNKTANTLFASFLLVTSFGMSALFLKDFYKEFDTINKLRVAAVFLQIPLFYFYIKKACFYNFKLAWKHLLHGIPFVIFTVLFMSVGITDQIDIGYAVISQVQYYSYMAAVFYMLLQYKRIHNENHSLENRAYSWLMTTSILFLLGNTLILFRGIFQAFHNYQSLPILNMGISLFGLGVISWFVLKAMRNPELFTSVYLTSALPNHTQINLQAEYENDILRLSEYMSEYKPYLEEEVTLHSLALKIGFKEKHLSFIINKVVGQHFFDFINSYRIEEAKELLKKKELNIQQIMFEVGFNSKSSFNTAFKKYTSLTPSEYRKSLD